MLLTILYVSHTHLPFLNEGKDHYKGYLQVHLEIWNAHDRPFRAMRANTTEKMAGTKNQKVWSDTKAKPLWQTNSVH